MTTKEFRAVCFSLQWIGQLLIWLVVICAVVALLRLVVGFVLPKLGIAADIIAVVVAAIRIVIWAIILIAIIVFVFDLIGCLAPSLSFPRMHGSMLLPGIGVWA
jgi:hypothetical protein